MSEGFPSLPCQSDAMLSEHWKTCHFVLLLDLDLSREGKSYVWSLHFHAAATAAMLSPSGPPYIPHSYLELTLLCPSCRTVLHCGIVQSDRIGRPFTSVFEERRRDRGCWCCRYLVMVPDRHHITQFGIYKKCLLIKPAWICMDSTQDHA